MDHLGGFDPALGPGGAFKAAGGEDSDMLVRAVAAGYKVLDADHPPVLHLGLRSAEEARDLVPSYAFGIGAAYAKHLRLGTRPGKALLVQWSWRYVWGAVKNLALRRRPLGLNFLKQLLLGAWSARRVPIDRSTGRFSVAASVSATRSQRHRTGQGVA
jgi:hypothetical protein